MTIGNKPSRLSPRRRLIGSPPSTASRIKARFAPADERVEHRRETARLLDELFAWIEATLGQVSAKLDLAKAFRYILSRRTELTRFLTDGRLEADNNIAENAIRTIAVGKTQLSLRGFRQRGETSRSHLYRRDRGKAQWPQPRGLPQARPDQNCRRTSDQPHRRVATLANGNPAATATRIINNTMLGLLLEQQKETQNPTYPLATARRYTWHAERLRSYDDC